MTMIEAAGRWNRTKSASRGSTTIRKFLFAPRRDDKPSAVERAAIEDIQPFFDRRFYLVRNADVAASGIDPILHFLRYGEAEHRDPSAAFCTRAFHLRHPELAASGTNALRHFAERQRRALPTVTDPVDQDDWLALHAFEVAYMKTDFDAAFYVARNMDIGTLDPLYHFAKFGWLEGRDPRADFSTTAYLTRYDDVAAAGINPFFHWLAEGRKEGRLACGPQGERDLAFEEQVMRQGFDEAYYLARVGAAELGQFGALRHFALHGWRDGRNPNRDFSVAGYLSTYDDVRSAGINPYYHWLVEGRREGRLPKPATDHRSAIVASLASLERRAADALSWAKDEDLAPEVLRATLNDLLAAPFALTVSHDDFSRHVGGVQLRIRGEAEAYRAAGLRHLHLFPGHGVLQTVAGGDPVLGILVDGRLLGHARCSAMTVALENARGEGESGATSSCAAFVVHSLLGHDVEALVRMVRCLGIAEASFWVHDYASVCAGLHLLRNDVQWCGAPPPESVSCRICVYGSKRTEQYRAHARLFAAVPFAAIAPSRVAAEIFRAHHPDVRVTVREHLVLGEQRSAPRSTGPLRIAFLGHPANHKGWPDFLDLVETFADGEGVQFLHIATSGNDLPGVRWIEAAPEADGSSSLGRMVEDAEVDYAFVGSSWKETFCLSAYEAVAGGAKVLTYDVSGNVAELVRAGHGTVFSALADVKSFIAERVARDDEPRTRTLYALEDWQATDPAREGRSSVGRH